MPKIIHEYNGILMDSHEEVQFAYWLDELKEAGYVEKWKYITKPFEITNAVHVQYFKYTQLKTKIKEEEKQFPLLANLEYTPDFKIKWTEKGHNKLVSDICIHIRRNGFNPKSWFFCGYRPCDEEYMCTWVENKPKFDMHGKVSRFSIIQKILWSFQGIFVDLVVNEDLFKDTFMPSGIMHDFKYKRDYTGKDKKLHKAGEWRTSYVPKTINEFLNQ